MDDAPEEPASIISFSAVPCSSGGQLILNGSSGFLTASQPLLLNGNSLISGASGGVIINGLNLGDCQTVTLSPVAGNSSLILNGAQVITKPGVQPQQTIAVVERDASAAESKLGTNTTPVSNPPPSVIPMPLPIKSNSDNTLDFISIPKENETKLNINNQTASSLSLSTPALSTANSIPTLVLTQTTKHQETITFPASAGTVISSPLSNQQGDFVVFATAGSLANPSSSIVSSSPSTPQVFSLPQVVPSIQGIPVSQLVQHTSAAQVSQCPQLVPVSPLTSPTPQYQSPINTGNRLVLQQQEATSTLPEGAVTTVSISQLANQFSQRIANHLRDQNSGKIPGPQVISISSPTQSVPAPKGTAAQFVSMPQLVPVSSIQTANTISFPQVVPSSPALTIPSAGAPLQILASPPGAGGLVQAPLRINQISPIQGVASPNSVAPGVQLLNSGIIQLPSASPGTIT